MSRRMGVYPPHTHRTPPAWLTAPSRPALVVLESCIIGRIAPRAHRGVDYRPQEGPR